MTTEANQAAIEFMATEVKDLDRRTRKMLEIIESLVNQAQLPPDVLRQIEALEADMHTSNSQAAWMRKCIETQEGHNILHKKGTVIAQCDVRHSK